MYQRLDNFLDYHARVHPDVCFVTEDSGSYTFAQARERVAAVAGCLQAKGLSKGDRIALLGKNSINFLFMYLACSKLGVVPVAVNYRLTPKESCFVIEDAGAKIVFADAEFISPLVAEGVELPVVVLYGELSGYTSKDDWLAGGDSQYKPADISPEDTLSQMYTSGTTGLPKGVLLSHNNVIANVHQTAMASEYTFRVGEEFLLVAPMYHAAGIMTAYTGLIQGLTLVIHRDYDPQRVIDTLCRRPIAAVTLVPAMLQFIIENIPGLSEKTFTHLQLIYYGASPMSVPLLKQAITIFSCDFTQGYGQTESNSILAMLSPSDHRSALQQRPELLGSCGRAAFNTELRVVDPEGNELPAGEAGEIIARGPQVMQGYWNNPQASAETLRGAWLHTGDIGTLDKEGYLRIVGRLKDMIISGGENIYPAEIETVLIEHPAIDDVAVVGVPDDKWGEVPMAFIVSQTPEALDLQTLPAFCQASLARYKVPAHFRLIDQLPRNPSGKILKQQLREQFGTA